MRMAYHRDPGHFSGIRPFDAEMRRRVWATIYYVDLGISAQMGLPRTIKERQVDMEPPRSLLDSDLDEAASPLPPSRPGAEVTPMLYVLAKNRVAAIGGAICDLITDIPSCTCDEVMRVDHRLQQTRTPRSRPRRRRGRVSTWSSLRRVNSLLMSSSRRTQKMLTSSLLPSRLSL